VIAGTDWNEWVGIGTLALAVATAILAFVSAAGVRVAARAGKDTRSLAETSEQEVRVLGEQIGIQREEVDAVLAQAEASRLQVETSQAALRATVRPILVNVPFGSIAPREPVQDGVRIGPGDDQFALVAPFAIHVAQSNEGPSLYVSVPARNVGTGVAIVQDAAILSNDLRARWDGTATVSVVPPGERTRATFRFPAVLHGDPLADERAVRIHNDMLGQDSGVRRFVVDIVYSDISGEQPTRSRFEIASISSREQPPNWRVLKVHLFRDDGAEPFVSSGIGAL
jgi:hypothetical protein